MPEHNADNVEWLPNTTSVVATVKSRMNLNDNALMANYGM